MKPDLEDLLGKLPVESEPDGDRYLGHHFWIGIMAMIVGWMQWTPHGTPTAAVILVVIGLLVVADDVVSHVFGISTPLDALFKAALRVVRKRL